MIVKPAVKNRTYVTLKNAATKRSIGFTVLDATPAQVKAKLLAAVKTDSHPEPVGEVTDTRSGGFANAVARGRSKSSASS